MWNSLPPQWPYCPLRIIVVRRRGCPLLLSSPLQLVVVVTQGEEHPMAWSQSACLLACSGQMLRLYLVHGRQMLDFVVPVTPYPSVHPHVLLYAHREVSLLVTDNRQTVSSACHMLSRES